MGCLRIFFQGFQGFPRGRRRFPAGFRRRVVGAPPSSRIRQRPRRRLPSGIRRRFPSGIRRRHLVRLRQVVRTIAELVVIFRGEEFAESFGIEQVLARLAGIEDGLDHGTVGRGGSLPSIAVPRLK